MKTPQIIITLDGKALPMQRLVSATLTDNRGLELDTLELILSDYDGKFDIPRKGVEVAVQIGYKLSPMINRGSYIIDSVAHSGPPDYIKLSGKSGNFDYSAMKTVKKKSYHKTTVGEMIKNFATAHSLKHKISEALANKAIEHIDQSSESDANLITRLAEQFDAVATIKAGTLIFLPINYGKTASNEELQKISIDRTDQDVHNYQSADRNKHTGVTARYWLQGKKNNKEIKVGEDGNRKIIKNIFASELEATNAAKAMWQTLQRESATIELTLADAPPNIYAESPIILTGWGKPEIDGDKWLATKVIYTLESNGLTCKISAETR